MSQLIHEIKELTLKLNISKIHVQRQQNEIANRLVKWGTKLISNFKGCQNPYM